MALKDYWIYRKIRSSIFKVVHPAQLWLHAESAEFKYARQNFIPQCGFQQVNYDLHGNMQEGAIDPKAQAPRFDATILFDEQSQNPFAKGNKIIIAVGGNLTCYEKQLYVMQAMVSPNVTVIGFNPRGVGLSPGETAGSEEYQAALESIIRNLLSQGVAAKDININGTSLGGAIALATAEKLHAEGIDVNGFADRTFNVLSETAGEIVKSFVPSWFRSTIGEALKYFVSGAIRFFDLEIDAGAAFESLNAKGTHAWGIYMEDDGVIPKGCSLIDGISPEMRQRDLLEKGYVVHLRRGTDMGVPVTIVTRPNGEETTYFGAANLHDIRKEDIYVQGMTGMQFMGQIFEDLGCRFNRPDAEATKKYVDPRGLVDKSFRLMPSHKTGYYWDALFAFEDKIAKLRGELKNFTPHFRARKGGSKFNPTAQDFYADLKVARNAAYKISVR